MSPGSPSLLPSLGSGEGPFLLRLKHLLTVHGRKGRGGMAEFRRQGRDGGLPTGARPYQEGDDLRLLDWKRLAREEAPFVKERERRTTGSLTLLLDTSASLGLPSSSPPWPALRDLSVCLLFLATEAGRGGRLCLAHEEHSHRFSGRRDLPQMVRLLDDGHPQGPTRFPAAAERFLGGASGTVVWLTDGLLEDSPLRATLAMLGRVKGDAAMGVVRGNSVLDEVQEGEVLELEDGETGVVRRVSGGAVGQSRLARAQGQHRQRLSRCTREASLPLVEMDSDGERGEALFRALLGLAREGVLSGGR